MKDYVHKVSLLIDNNLCLFLLFLLLSFHYIDAINTVSMEQDDPCILHQLRNNYLEPPSKESLSLEHPETENPSMGQAQSVLEILNNKVLQLFEPFIHSSSYKFNFISFREKDFSSNVVLWMEKSVQIRFLWSKIWTGKES